MNGMAPRLHYSIASLFAMFGLLACAGSVSAAPNREIDGANALYRAGNYQEALDTYSRMAEENPESPELAFNRGAAQFQLGDTGRAHESFEEAGLLSEDPALQALCSYNMGNCTFEQAQKELSEHPEEALESLNKSLGYYRDALARNPDLKPAAHNQEMAKRAIQQIQEQMKQQEQQQQEQQKKKQEEMKKKLDELIEEQQLQNQQSEEASQQQEDPSQPDPSPQQMDGMAEDQKETREKTEDLSEQMDSGGEQTPPPMDEAKQQTEDAAKKQQEAEEHLKNQEPKEANEAQEEALDKLKKAREALDQDGESDEKQGQKGDQEDKPSDSGQKQPKPDSQDQPGEPDDQPPQPQPTPEEMKNVPPPDATARDILNQEKRNKEERELREMVRLRPVEKDW